jgi:hypothetical protein
MGDAGRSSRSLTAEQWFAWSPAERRQPHTSRGPCRISPIERDSFLKN